ncbi:MAG: hypothetical protein AB1540_13015, partial [Bdellovibrionota bacterium]
PDQKYMGGFTGSSSQGFRHMFYRAWSLMEPLVTFHFPLHEMGQAPDRAALYFKLALQAGKAGHAFWAHRFLGWGLHYVQDLSQPYHASQFASFRLLPIMTLIRDGWEATVRETTRRVSNYHLSFEDYTDLLLASSSSESGLELAFRVPKPSRGLNEALGLEETPRLSERIRELAAVSSRLASAVVRAQGKLMKDELLTEGVDIGKGSKVDYEKLAKNSSYVNPREELYSLQFEALSNTGLAARWYTEQYYKQLRLRK